MHGSLRGYTTLSIFCSFLSVIVGCGLTSLPYAFRQAGFFAGPVLLVVVAVLTERSIRIITWTSEAVNATSYEDFVDAVFGRVGCIVPLVTVFGASLSAVVSHIVMADQAVTLILKSANVSQLPFWVANTIITAIAMLPLFVHRDIASLGKYSALVVVTCFAFVVITTVHGHTSASSMDPPLYERVAVTHTWLLPVRFSAFPSLRTFALTFAVHHVALPLRGAVSAVQWSRVRVTAIMIATTLCIAAAIGGFAAYKDCTPRVLLLALPPRAALSLAAHALVAVGALLVIPVEAFVAARAVIGALHAAGYLDKRTVPPRRAWTAIVCCIGAAAAAISVGLAAIPYDTSHAVDAARIVFSVANGYLVPPVAYYRLKALALAARSDALDDDASPQPLPVRVPSHSLPLQQRASESIVDDDALSPTPSAHRGGSAARAPIHPVSPHHARGGATGRAGGPRRARRIGGESDESDVEALATSYGSARSHRGRHAVDAAGNHARVRGRADGRAALLVSDASTDSLHDRRGSESDGSPCPERSPAVAPSAADCEDPSGSGGVHGNGRPLLRGGHGLAGGGALLLSPTAMPWVCDDGDGSDAHSSACSSDGWVGVVESYATELQTMRIAYDVGALVVLLCGTLGGIYVTAIIIRDMVAAPGPQVDVICCAADLTSLLPDPTASLCIGTTATPSATGTMQPLASVAPSLMGPFGL